MNATFDDGGTPGSVTLTLANTNLTGAEFVFEWLLNLDPVLDPTNLIFSAVIEKSGNFNSPIVSTATDGFQADGDGMFDIKVAFSTANGSSKRFGRGDTAEYTITGIASLIASSFDFISAKDGGQGEYLTAAHVGNTGPGGNESGWVTIPEPATLSLLGIAALAVVARKRS